ncbi:hypothetical protein RJ639_004761 [Escallonia herrerae]|uniref:Uncharacterized protein n=1 Tax=Escallonia herrerae TaxID=1293975 RepID=A0AA88W2Z4_9ASTE|nr:hypothetical protein RJ639_004761 [Escallonia herrerae]
MVSLRFPSFSQPPRPPSSATTTRTTSFSATAVACSVAVTAFAGIAAVAAISQNPSNPFLHSTLNFFLSKFSPHPSPIWGSLSLSDSSPPAVTESKTGVSFSPVLRNAQRLLGIGSRKKAVLGLKNIDVYAFGTKLIDTAMSFVGVYADDSDVKKFLSDKYGALSLS